MKKNRIFVILLAACMILLMAPAAFAAGVSDCQGECDHIAAIGEVHYDTLADAIGAASGDSATTITLLKDTVENIDTAGKSLTITADENNKPNVKGRVTIGAGEVVIENLKIETAAANTRLITINSGAGKATIKNCELTVNHVLSDDAAVIHMTGAPAREIDVIDNEVICNSNCTSVFRVNHSNSDMRTGKVLIQGNDVSGKWQYGVFRGSMCDVIGNTFSTTVTEGDSLYDAGGKPVAIHYYSYIPGVTYDDVHVKITGNTFTGLQSAISIYNIDAFINADPDDGEFNSYIITGNTFNSCVNAFVQKTNTDTKAAEVAGAVESNNTLTGTGNSVGTMNIKGYVVEKVDGKYHVTKDSESYVFEKLGDSTMQAGYNYFKGLITDGVSDGKTYVVGDSFGMTLSDGYGRPYYLDDEGVPYYKVIDNWLHYNVATAERFYLEDGQSIDDTDGEVFLTANGTRYRLNGSIGYSLCYCDEQGVPFYKGGFGPVYISGSQHYTVLATKDIYASKFLLATIGNVQPWLMEHLSDNVAMVAIQTAGNIGASTYFSADGETWTAAGYYTTIQTWNENKLIISAEIEDDLTISSSCVTYADIKDNIGNGVKALKTEVADSDVIFAASGSLSNAYKAIFDGVKLTGATLIVDQLDQPVGYIEHEGEAYLGYKNNANYANKNILFEYASGKIIVHLISQYAVGGNIPADEYYEKCGVDSVYGFAQLRAFDLNDLLDITFDANGGSVSEESRVIISGEAIGTLPTPTRSGYTFNGWFTAATGGAEITAVDVFSADTSLYAQWTLTTYTTSITTTPANAAIVVKDSEGNEVAAEDDGTYSLVNGTYTYFVSKAGYVSKSGTFTVDGSAAEISVTLSAYSSDDSYTPSYSVAVENVENGSVKASPAGAYVGSIVTITVDPDVGYELAELTVLDKNGIAVDLTEKSDNQYIFKMPNGKVTVEATFMKSVTENIFVDVAESAYYYDAVQWAVENEITTGTGADTFSPNAVCTRAQVVTFLWRAAGCPEPVGSAIAFDDVSFDAYYTKAVQWAVEQGITFGTGDNKFDPDAECTRGQIITFLWRSLGSEDATANNPFVDVVDGAYYEDAVLWAVGEAITNGTAPDTFSPDADCTRGQIVTFLYRCQAE